MVGLAGCYGPSVQDGLPCGAGRVCPADQTCDVDDRCRTTPSAGGDASSDGLLDDGPLPIDAIDGNPNVDTDGDTINDAADNCRTMANLDQRDHDSDLVGDVCDNCPHVANPNQQAIQDSDPVGDACDPNNGRADALVFFEGFYAMPSGWILPAGEWGVSNGQLVATIAGAATVAYRDIAVPADLTIITRAGLVAGTGLAPNAGVLGRVAGGIDYYRCAVVDTGTDRAELARHTTAGFTTLQQLDLPGATFADIGLRLENTGAAMACDTRAGSATLVLPPATDPTPLTGTRVGFRVREATAAFDYLVVYSH